MKRTWSLIAVAAAGALGGLAVTGLPSDVPDDLVITELPPPSTTPATIPPTTVGTTTTAGS